MNNPNHCKRLNNPHNPHNPHHCIQMRANLVCITSILKESAFLAQSSSVGELETAGRQPASQLSVSTTSKSYSKMARTDLGSLPSGMQLCLTRYALHFFFSLPPKASCSLDSTLELCCLCVFALQLDCGLEVFGCFVQNVTQLRWIALRDTRQICAVLGMIVSTSRIRDNLRSKKINPVWILQLVFLQETCHQLPIQRSLPISSPCRLKLLPEFREFSLYCLVIKHDDSNCEIAPKLACGFNFCNVDVFCEINGAPLSWLLCQEVVRISRRRSLRVIITRRNRGKDTVLQSLLRSRKQWWSRRHFPSDFVSGALLLHKAAKLDKDFVKRMCMSRFAYWCPMKPSSEGFFRFLRAVTKRQAAFQEWIGPIRKIQNIFHVEIWTRKSLRYMPHKPTSCVFQANLKYVLENIFCISRNESNAFVCFKCHHCNGEYSSLRCYNTTGHRRHKFRRNSHETLREETNIQ